MLPVVLPSGADPINGEVTVRDRTNPTSRRVVRVVGGAVAGLGLATVLGAVLASPAAATDTQGATPNASSGNDICIIGVIGNCSSPPTVSLPPTESEPPPSSPPPPPPTTQAPPPTQINQPAPSSSSELIANNNATATPTAAGPTLPTTGTDLGLIAGVGAALAGAGGVLVLSTRRRDAAPLEIVDVSGTSDDEE
jgi:LPXTG-motif cell wall-anchored protein